MSCLKETHRETEDSASVESSATRGGSDVLMSPAVRVLLETYKLNPGLIQATGPKGRLLKGDVLRYVAQEGQPFTKQVETASPEAKGPTETTASQPAKPSPQKTGRYCRNVPRQALILVCYVIGRSWRTLISLHTFSSSHPRFFL